MPAGSVRELSFTLVKRGHESLSGLKKNRIRIICRNISKILDLLNSTSIAP